MYQNYDNFGTYMLVSGTGLLNGCHDVVFDYLSYYSSILSTDFHVVQCYIEICRNDGVLNQCHSIRCCS